MSGSGISARLLLDATFHSRFENADGDHGRSEVRRHSVSHDNGWLTSDRRLPAEPRFPGLCAIAVVEAEVERNGVSSLEQRYCLSMMPLDAKLSAHAVRCAAMSKPACVGC